MLLHRLTRYILARRFQGVAVAFGASFIPVPGCNLGVLVAVLLTLCKGAREGSLAFFAVLAAGLLEYIVGRTPENSHLLMMLTAIGFFAALLTWFFALLLRYSRNWSLVIEVSALLGMLVVLVLHGVFPTIQGWWAAQFSAWFLKDVSFIGAFLPAEGSFYNQLLTMPSFAREALFKSASHYVTGMLVTLFLFSILSQVVLGRWWQKAFFAESGGLRPKLYSIRHGRFTALLFIVVIMTAGLFHSALAADVLPVLMTAFFLAGLSLVHALVAWLKKGRSWLIVAYGGLFFAWPLLVPLFAMIALLDVVADFRGRLMKIDQKSVSV